MKTPGFARLLLVVVAVVTVACGDSKSSLNPTAPSVLSSGSLTANADNAVESEATGNNGNGNGNGNGNAGSNNGGNNGKGGPPATTPGNGGSGNTSPSAPGQARIQIEGLITTVGTSSIEVNGQSVQVTSDTVIRHGNRQFGLADLKRGDRVHVRAERLESMALRAAEIKLQNPGDAADGELVVPTGLVSVTAADGAAAEWPTAGVPDTATFRLTRAGDASLLAAPLTVTFTLSGTATNGSDYTNLPLTATFAAGVATADVVVSPLNDGVLDGAETVLLTLTAVAPYELGSPVSAEVTIAPAPTGRVSVTASDDLASERATASGPDTGTFRLTREGDATLQASALTVSFTVTGSATSGADYTALPTSVTFAAGVSSVDVVVTPLADTLDDSDETVVLTLTGVAPYEPGAPASATVMISPPEVSVEAVDPNATEAGDTGTFRLTRTGDLSRSMSVTVVFGGTATNGVDYRLNATTVVFQAGQATRDVVIQPVTDSRDDQLETVVLSVTDLPEYDRGTPWSATITITGS
jgi:hypothetical protein